MERRWLNIAQPLSQTGTHRQIGMGSITFRSNHEEATRSQLPQAARIFVVIARLHRLINLVGQALKLFLIHSHTTIELDE